MREEIRGAQWRDEGVHAVHQIGTVDSRTVIIL